MNNGQNLARARHLEDVANGAKRYILAEILDVTNAVASELENLIGGTSYADFTGATSIAGGASGLVPAPSIGDQTKFLRGDGSWASVLSGEYSLPTANATQKGGVKIGDGLSMNGDTLNVTISGGTSYANFTGATSIAGGASGLVPAPSIGDEKKFLRGDGSWASVSSGEYSLPTANATQKGGVKIGDGLSMNGDTLNVTISGGTSYANFTGATSIAGGASGLVPSPAAGDQTKFLRGDGSWALPTVSSGGGNVLSTVASSVDGGLWYEILGDAPAIKLSYQGKEVAFMGTRVDNISSVLNNCTWAEISWVSKAGIGDTYWDIGDCKEITLNGSIGSQLTLSNQTLCVFILHFNYPLNGTPDNNIIWGGFKTADGTDVALCDSKYNSSSMDGTICFNMNHNATTSNGSGYNGTNYGGWKGTDLRYDILGATSQAPSQYNQLKIPGNVGYNATEATLTNPKANTLLAALPAAFRNVLRLWSRWVDAKGNQSNVEANIEEAIDAVTLLTEFEVQGARLYANDYEKNHQTQMDYYKNGNSKIKYRHDSTSSVYWWCSSPFFGNHFVFCYVRADGSSNVSEACIAYGIAPAFMT